MLPYRPLYALVVFKALLKKTALLTWNYFWYATQHHSTYVGYNSYYIVHCILISFDFNIKSDIDNNNNKMTVKKILLLES